MSSVEFTGRCLKGCGVAAIDIDRVARKNGMISLFEDSMWKVRDGITSLAEALRSVSVEKD